MLKAVSCIDVWLNVQHILGEYPLYTVGAVLHSIQNWKKGFECSHHLLMYSWLRRRRVKQPEVIIELVIGCLQVPFQDALRVQKRESVNCLWCRNTRKRLRAAGLWSTC